MSMPPIIAAATWASATASQQENIGSIDSQAKNQSDGMKTKEPLGHIVVSND
jgi:hypothetical protein